MHAFFGAVLHGTDKEDSDLNLLVEPTSRNDSSALACAGLILRDENGIRAPYDSAQATISLGV